MKLTCDVIKDLFPGYIDELCSEDSRKVVEAHIADCECCRELLEILKKPVESEYELNVEKIKIDNPLKKIKKRHHRNIAISIGITAIIVMIFMMVVQHVGVLHDIFYPELRVVIRSEKNDDTWNRVEFEGQEYLEFNSMFYQKKVTNSANSSGSISICIYDMEGETVIQQIYLEPGTSKKLEELDRYKQYIIKVQADMGEYFLRIY